MTCTVEQCLFPPFPHQSKPDTKKCRALSVCKTLQLWSILTRNNRSQKVYHFDSAKRLYTLLKITSQVCQFTGIENFRCQNIWQKSKHLLQFSETTTESVSSETRVQSLGKSSSELVWTSKQTFQTMRQKTSLVCFSYTTEKYRNSRKMHLT